MAGNERNFTFWLPFALLTSKYEVGHPQVYVGKSVFKAANIFNALIRNKKQKSQRVLSSNYIIIKVIVYLWIKNICRDDCQNNLKMLKFINVCNLRKCKIISNENIYS